MLFLVKFGFLILLDLGLWQFKPHTWPTSTQTIYDFNLVRVHLDSSVSHYIAEELAQTYPKRAFRGIKTELVSPQNFEDVCEVP